MVHNIAITKARINLGSLAKRAYLKGEYFILEKDGIPIAGLMSSDEMEDYLELQDPKVNKIIIEGNKDIIAGRVIPGQKLLTELRQIQSKQKAKLKNAKH